MRKANNNLIARAMFAAVALGTRDSCVDIWRGLTPDERVEFRRWRDEQRQITVQVSRQIGLDIAPWYAEGLRNSAGVSKELRRVLTPPIKADIV